MGRDRALPQDHLLRINVVMDRVERLSAGHSGSLQQDFRHLLSVPAGKTLTDLHIMQVISQVLSIQEA